MDRFGLIVDRFGLNYGQIGTEDTGRLGSGNPGQLFQLSTMDSALKRLYPQDFLNRRYSFLRNRRIIWMNYGQIGTELWTDWDLEVSLRLGSDVLDLSKVLQGRCCPTMDGLGFISVRISRSAEDSLTSCPEFRSFFRIARSKGRQWVIKDNAYVEAKFQTISLALRRTGLCLWLASQVHSQQHEDFELRGM